MVAKRKKTALLTPDDVGLHNNPNQHIPVVHTDELDYEGLAKLKFDVLSDQQVVLDTTKSAEYLDLPIYPGEREVTDTHVQFLYDEMKKGTFNPLLVILSTAVFQGVTYKINGQHTCWAVVYMNEQKKGYTLNVREIRYKVHSADQLKLLYASYDRLKARSDSHVSKVFLIGTAAAEGVWSSTINKAVSAFSFWHVTAEVDRRRISPEQLAAVIQRDYCELFQTVAKYVQERHNEPLAKRQPVIAAMFATFQKVATKAPEFWQPVLDGVGLNAKTDPRYALRETLMKATTKVSGGARDKRLVSAEELYRICIQAFNKWRKGETVQATLRPTKERIKPV